MKKILLLIMILLIPIVTALGQELPECQRKMQPKDIPCNIITSYTPSDGCNKNITIFNSSGDIIQVGNYGVYTPTCNYTMNISDVGTYQYNSSIEDGVFTIEGDNDIMILVVFGILILFNLLLVYLPFKITFSKHKAANFVIRHFVWISAILFFWFNITMLRQVAQTWGLGIDSFLLTYWWIFTLLTFASVFIIVYVSFIGAMKIMKDVKLQQRFGEFDND